MENELYDNKIRVDNVVYNLNIWHGNITNVLVHMDGVKVSKDPGSLEPLIAINRHCCVFSDLLDILAYITLCRHGDSMCRDIPSADFMVMTPDCNYSLAYDKLKRYEQVYGFMRINEPNREANTLLADLLDGKFKNNDDKFFEDYSLANYCIRTYRVIEL